MSVWVAYAAALWLLIFAAFHIIGAGRTAEGYNRRRVQCLGKLFFRAVPAAIFLGGRITRDQRPSKRNTTRLVSSSSIMAWGAKSGAPIASQDWVDREETPAQILR